MRMRIVTVTRKTARTSQCPDASQPFAGASLASMATSSPIEVRTMTSFAVQHPPRSRWRYHDLLVSFSSTLKSFSIFSPTSPSGTLTSSLVSPSSDMRERNPSSETSSWYRSVTRYVESDWAYLQAGIPCGRH